MAPRKLGSPTRRNSRRPKNKQGTGCSGMRCMAKTDGLHQTGRFDELEKAHISRWPILVPPLRLAATERLEAARIHGQDRLGRQTMGLSPHADAVEHPSEGGTGWGNRQSGNSARHGTNASRPDGAPTGGPGTTRRAWRTLGFGR